MSYCRWSSDDFQCDLYIYEDVDGGWTTCVAGNRMVYAKPLPPEVEPGDSRAYAMRMSTVSDLRDDPGTTRVPIGLRHDGKTFNSETLAELEELLLSLRAIGYRFPDYVLDTIREEMKS